MTWRGMRSRPAMLRLSTAIQVVQEFQEVGVEWGGGHLLSSGAVSGAWSRWRCSSDRYDNKGC
jgi:hypothetical protein